MKPAALALDIGNWKDSVVVNGKTFHKTRVWFDIEKQKGAAYTCIGCGSNFDGRVSKLPEVILEHSCPQKET
jgi:hypothetical protein